MTLKDKHTNDIVVQHLNILHTGKVNFFSIITTTANMKSKREREREKKNQLNTNEHYLVLMNKSQSERCTRL